MNEWIKDAVKSVLNPSFEDIAAESIVLKYNGVEITGYTGSLNEDVVDIGMNPLKIVKVLSNNLLFDPDKTCMVQFDYLDTPNPLVIDDIVLSMSGGIEAFLAECSSLLGEEYKVINNDPNIIILKLKLIDKSEEFTAMYVEGLAVADLGIEEGYYESMKANFLINGDLHYVRQNTMKPCYAGQYLKFQLIRSN